MSYRQRFHLFIPVLTLGDPTSSRSAAKNVSHIGGPLRSTIEIIGLESAVILLGSPKEQKHQGLRKKKRFHLEFHIHDWPVLFYNTPQMWF